MLYRPGDGATQLMKIFNTYTIDSMLQPGCQKMRCSFFIEVLRTEDALRQACDKRGELYSPAKTEASGVKIFQHITISTHFYTLEHLWWVVGAFSLRFWQTNRRLYKCLPPWNLIGETHIWHRNAIDHQSSKPRPDLPCTAPWDSAAEADPKKQDPVAETGHLCGAVWPRDSAAEADHLKQRANQRHVLAAAVGHWPCPAC